MQVVLEREQVTARARLEEERQAQAAIEAENNRKRREGEAEKARRDATDARVQEARLVRMARGSAGNLMASLGKMTEGVDRLCQQLDTQLKMWATPRLDPSTGLPVKMSAVELRTTTQFLATLGTAVRQVNEAGAKAIEMERVLLGEPTHIVGVQNVSAMSYADMERTVKLGMLAVERARARGLVVDAPVPKVLGSGALPDIIGDNSKVYPVVPPGIHEGHGATTTNLLPSTAEKSSIGMGNEQNACGATIPAPVGTVNEIKSGCRCSGGAPDASITGASLPTGAHPFPSDVLAGIRTAPGAVGGGATEPRRAGNLKVVG
jgi:hypothetical protein